MTVKIGPETYKVEKLWPLLYKNIHMTQH